ncbi:MAG TPA: hypothetical protein VIR63_03705, partial [Pontiella sp.]
MNCTFKSYPSHPWNRGWTFEPRNCPSNIREKQPEKLFKALETMGSISSCEEDEAWNLNIPIPENSRLALLFNGFCAYLKKKDKLYAAEVLIPAPGIIWGRIRGIPIPALSSRNNLQTEGALQWTENHSSTILLEVQENNFCLVCSQTLKEAQQIAGNYLSLDFEKAIRQEVDNRQGATHLFEEMSHHDALAVICVESMMKALRPPEGNIPHLWSQASDSTTPHLNINETCPLALAWRHINIDVAEE